MAEKFRASPSKNGPKQLNPAGIRTFAILIMLAGAVGFAAALVIYGDQVLCLFGSTLITFAGLGVLIWARRLNPQDHHAGAGMAAVPGDQPELGPGQYRQAPPGLRAAARRRNRDQSSHASIPPKQVSTQSQLMDHPEEGAERFAPTPEPASLEEATGAGPLPGGNELLEQVISILEGQGAQVEVESRREGRGILRIRSADGKIYSALVQDGPGVVDVSDVRALNALAVNSGSAGGYFIASGMFTQKAYDWATARQIRLVVDDELDELSL